MSSVYIHGTNGSGKTTLARALMICAGGIDLEADVHYAKVTIMYRNAHGLKDVVFIGRYRGPTGGMDTIQPYENGVQAALTRGGTFGEPIVMESMVTPGLETCQKLSAGIPDLTFFWLDTPVAQCIKQTKERRAARGNENEFDSANLERKAQSVASWYARLKAAGLRIEKGDWSYVYARCKCILNIVEPDTAVLLD